MPSCQFCGGSVQPFWKACPACGAGVEVESVGVTNRSKGADECFCFACGSIVKQAAEICPKCGVRHKPAATSHLSPPAPQVVVVQQAAPLPPPTPAAPVNGGMGCCLGSTFGFLLMTGGAFVSLTGVGLIVGIPAILLGLVLPFLGGTSLFATGLTWQGACPHCRTGLNVPVQGPSFTCGACRRAFVLNQNARQFHPLP